MYYSWFLPSILVYLILALIISAFANRRKIGRLKVFFISLFFTPLMGFVIYKLSQPSYLQNFTRYRCPECVVDFTEPHKDCPLCRKKGQHTRLIVVKYAGI